MAEGREEERLRRNAARVEELLDEVQEMVGPPAWRRVEELVTCLVGLYGAGLSRILEHLEREGALNSTLEERLLGDETVESLLLLHGLHPRSGEEQPDGELVTLDVGRSRRRRERP